VRVLALDISTSTGFAVLNSESPKPESFGTITLDKRAKDYAAHPWGYFLAARDLATKLVAKIEEIKPDVVVVEETNGSRSRMTQKYLEYLHFSFLEAFRDRFCATRLYYIDTRVWRKTMDVRLTAADKSQNAKLSRNKRKAADKGMALDKKALGIRGRINIKHVAIRHANELFGLELLAKDDDVADALMLGSAFLRNCPICTGND
jgi:hypothetical protein